MGSPALRNGNGEDDVRLALPLATTKVHSLARSARLITIRYVDSCEEGNSKVCYDNETLFQAPLLTQSNRH